MPNEAKSSSDLSRDLLRVLAEHGVVALPEKVTRGPRELEGGVGPLDLAPRSGGYIKEIITSAQEFDEEILERVASVLSRGAAPQ